MLLMYISMLNTLENLKLKDPLLNQLPYLDCNSKLVEDKKEKMFGMDLFLMMNSKPEKELGLT